MRREQSIQAGVLVDVAGQSLIKDAALVVGFAGLIGLLAQISIPLPFTPVPITGQTLAVLLGASLIGPVRGILGSGLYLALGLAGVPWFAGGNGGTGIITAPSFGYLIGFIAASMVVGALALRGFDRSALGTVGEMVIGNIVIYAFGLSWLGFSLHLNIAQTVGLGATPFLVGDLLKIVFAATVLPGAWKVVDRMNGPKPQN